MKTRLGWENDDDILTFVPKLVEAGIDALILHGRTYKDGFRGKARWENIFEVKKMFPGLVVVGNGDITKLEVGSQGAEVSFSSNFKLPTSNQLDGFAIGRATFGKPWIFSKESVSTEELKDIILLHAKLTFERKGEKGMIEFRKHLLAYLKGFSNAKELRKEAVLITKLEDIPPIIFQI